MNNWEDTLDEYLKGFHEHIERVKWGRVTFELKNGVVWRIIEEKSIETAKDEWKQ